MRSLGFLIACLFRKQTGQKKCHIDIGIHSVNFDNKNFGWTTDINFSYYRNHTTKRDPDFIPAVYQDYVERWDNIYGYRTNGLIQMDRTYNHLQKSGAGAILYQDLNGYQLDEKGEKMRDSEGRCAFHCCFLTA